MQWAEKFGEIQKWVNAIGAHHDEVEMTSLLSPIIQVADAIFLVQDQELEDKF